MIRCEFVIYVVNRITLWNKVCHDRSLNFCYCLKNIKNTVLILHFKIHITDIGYDGNLMLEYNFIDGNSKL